LTAHDADDALAALLAQGMSYADAGRACGVSESTVSRRMASAAFRAKVATRRALIVEQLTNRILGLADDAVAALRALLTDPDAHQPSRVRAALSVLTLAAAMPREAEQLSQSAASAEKIGELTDMINQMP
jgi:DNA-binding CsgD family transcriptional regulator